MLFAGDHVMAWATSIVAPPDGAMSDYMASLKKLAKRGEGDLSARPRTGDQGRLAFRQLLHPAPQGARSLDPAPPRQGRDRHPDHRARDLYRHRSAADRRRRHVGAGASGRPGGARHRCNRRPAGDRRRLSSRCALGGKLTLPYAIRLLGIRMAKSGPAGIGALRRSVPPLRAFGLASRLTGRHRQRGRSLGIAAGDGLPELRPGSRFAVGAKVGTGEQQSEQDTKHKAHHVTPLWLSGPTRRAAHGTDQMLLRSFRQGRQAKGHDYIGSSAHLGSIWLAVLNPRPSSFSPAASAPAAPSAAGCWRGAGAAFTASSMSSSSAWIRAALTPKSGHG